MRGAELSRRDPDVPPRIDLLPFREAAVRTRRWSSRGVDEVGARGDDGRRGRNKTVCGVRDRDGRRGLKKTLGIVFRVVGCREESQLVARPSEFAVLVIVASLLIEVV